MFTVLVWWRNDVSKNLLCQHIEGICIEADPKEGCVFVLKCEDGTKAFPVDEWGFSFSQN
jgi:hypothetical protein